MKLHDMILTQEDFMFNAMLEHIKKVKDMREIRAGLRRRQEKKKTK